MLESARDDCTRKESLKALIAISKSAFKKAVSLAFEMTDIALMSYYLGLEVKQMEEASLCLKKAIQKKF